MNDDPERPVLALIGPMPPHRGGIAQYGLHLHRALAARQDAVTFAFSRQYPGWLYPGASDIDPDAESVGDLDVRRTIDSLNPLSWLATARAIAALRPGALVIQWWTVFWWPVFMLIARHVRKRGIPVVLLCHNVVDHEVSSWKEWLSVRMLALADGYIVHSATHRDALQARFPERPLMLAPIPSYGHRTEPVGPPEQRGRLELLFFGFLRPYKGLDVLLDALEMLPDESIHLTVAGEAWDDCRDVVERLRRMEGPGVETHIEFVPESTAARLFQRADAVVLPYRAASGSAVTSLAYGFGKPIIASRVGGLIDAVAEGETGLFFNPGDPGDLARILRGITREQLRDMSASVIAYTQRNGWAQFADGVSQLVRSVRARAHIRKEAA